MTIIKKFPKEFMLEEVLDGDEDRIKILKDEIMDTSRWSIHYELVFHIIEENITYRTYYSVGATESQDEGPWEYEDEVECRVVNPIERIIIDYVDA